jgi:hypothetical protein
MCGLLYADFLGFRSISGFTGPPGWTQHYHTLKNPQITAFFEQVVENAENHW